VSARTSAAAVLGFALFAAIRAADPPAAPAPVAPSASVRDAVYFGPAGPVRIRLHVSIDGRPADTVWNEALDALFALRDANGDGALDAAERAPLVTAPRVPRELDLMFNGAALQPLRLNFNEKDKVTRAVFAEAVKAAGRGAVGLRAVGARPESKQLSAALFKHLDQNGDGRLAPDELKAARERLAALDIDEDEFITTAELLGRAVGANVQRPFVIPGQRQPEESAETSNDLLFLTADGAQAVKQVLAARGGPRATSLRATDIGADAKTFAALDQDGNGQLDTTELTAWLRKAPDLELALSFDATGARLAPVPATAHAVDKSGGVSVALPGGRFRFEAPVAPTKEWEKAAEALAARFKELAKEPGAVERKQLENQLPELAFFDIADRNADGKVDAAEVAGALKALAPLARCRADVAFVDLGNGLFELLDRNGDGKLSPRELVESVAVLKPFAAADGTVGPKDLVRQFQVRTALDPIPLGVLVTPALTAPTEKENPKGPAVPVWFTKMDRNGDGDVSLKEFVGPLDLFRKLDRDGDGLISPAEARAEK
jgi:Ca2+-binding EF-hand superfamily protein